MNLWLRRIVIAIMMLAAFLGFLVMIPFALLIDWLSQTDDPWVTRASAKELFEMASGCIREGKI